MQLPKKYYGLYSDNYQIDLKKYEGPDYSKLCFIFPGQNSGFPGMMKQFINDIVSNQKTLEHANDLCAKYQLPLVESYLKRPEIMTLQEQQQVAVLSLFTLQVMTFNELIAKDFIPSILTSHSIGEAAALVCSGIYSFDDMFDFVAYREKLSPPPFATGPMIAISCNTNKLAKLNIPNIYISNINSPIQTVVSTSERHVNQVCSTLNKNNLTYIILKDIPQPYHCPLLTQLSNDLIHHINNKKYELHTPKYPFFSSVLTKIIDDKPLDHESLTKQTINQVNFRKQISSIYFDKLAYSFVELSSKSICSKFVRQTIGLQDHSIIPISRLLHSEKQKRKKYILDKEGNKIFRFISKIIARVTGYGLESITVEDHYQEDLNIDSIKKAEIFYEILNDSNLDPNANLQISQIDTIAETIEFLKNPPPTIMEKKERKFERYEIIWERFEDPEREEILFSTTIDLINLPEAIESKDSLLITSLNCSDSYEKILFPFILLWKKSDTSKIKHVSLVSNDETKAIPFALQAFFLSLMQERSNFTFNHIIKKDYLSNNTLKKFPHSIIKIDNNQFYIPKLSRKSITYNPDRFPLKTILAFGGAKGITFSLLKSIPNSKETTLYLAGRSPLQSQNESIEELKILFLNVIYKQVDVTNSQQVNQLFNAIPSVDLMIFGAGIENSSLFDNKKINDIKKELDTKILGTLNVNRHRDKFENAFFFSSIAALFGNGGQAVYACANAFMSRISKGKNIHWPAWNNTGMTASAGVTALLQQMGINPLPPNEARDLFTKDITQNNFAEITYLEQENALAYQMNLSSKEKYSHFIGIPIAPLKSIFVKTFSLEKESFLHGHAVNGKIILPAAYALAQLATIGLMRDNHLPTIKNFTISNPLLISNGDNVFISLFEDSATINGQLHHFAATLAKRSFTRLDFKEQEQFIEIAHDEIYSQYLFHRHPFELLKHAIIYNDNSAKAQIELTQINISGDPQLDALPFLIDAALQLAGLTISIKHHQKAIPVSIESVEFGSHQFGKNTLQTTIDAVGPDLTCNAMISMGCNDLIVIRKAQFKPL